MRESMSICPGCGLKLISENQELDERYFASGACVQLYWELSAFTLSLRDTDFIHQLAVDAYAAQHSGPQVKPISTAFALIGLYLTFKRGYTGREVQKAHMALDKLHIRWPVFEPPTGKSALTVLDAVRNVTAENHRELITKWGKSVWDTWQPEHERISRLVELYLRI